MGDEVEVGVALRLYASQIRIEPRRLNIGLMNM